MKDLIDRGNYMPTPKQPYSAIDDSIGYLNGRLSRVIKRHFEQLLDETGAGVTPQMWLLLSTIAHKKITIPSNIADITGIDRTATARCLTKMSKLNLVTRKQSVSDGRSSEVMLTKKGEKVLKIAANCSQQTSDHFYSKISNKERELLKKIFLKLLEGEQGSLKSFDDLVV
ncbi:MarR family winged helix-turn-helix transcriptional regulator [Zooshikella sp. RANM57]|uniref:MarR family winged helix-turn-helix transcriptional regulator n=1 Tax=Zooshikella sp. RANM57 TaxID=3425863 RepID=UPI003D6F36A0